MRSKRLKKGAIPLRERRSLGEEWKDYAKLIPDGSPAVQYNETRRAFYAGALTMFSLMSGGLDEDKEPTDLDVAYLDSLFDELVAFTKALDAGIV